MRRKGRRKGTIIAGEMVRSRFRRDETNWRRSKIDNARLRVLPGSNLLKNSAVKNDVFNQIKANLSQPPTSLCGWEANNRLSRLISPFGLLRCSLCLCAFRYALLCLTSSRGSSHSGGISAAVVTSWRVIGELDIPMVT